MAPGLSPETGGSQSMRQRPATLVAKFPAAANLDEGRPEWTEQHRYMDSKSTPFAATRQIGTEENSVTIED